MELRKETCYECEKYLRYMESIPAKQMGVSMHMGERFCIGGKRARRFKRNDPKIYVPTWCPKKKTPSELRVYGFKSMEDWMLHERLCHDLGKEIAPEAHRYAVLYELHTPFSPLEFARRCNEDSDAETVGAAVHRHYVVEIDDGISPAFFYKTEHGYRLEALFDAATARKNKREDTD